MRDQIEGLAKQLASNQYLEVTKLVFEVAQFDARAGELWDPIDWVSPVVASLVDYGPLSQCDADRILAAAGIGPHLHIEDGQDVADSLLYYEEDVDWAGLAGYLDVAPKNSPVIECWAVSRALAGLLLEQSERVLIDWHGLYIWGRQNNERPLYQDATIRTIAYVLYWSGARVAADTVSKG